MDCITTTIEREWLADIIAGVKKTKYRRLAKEVCGGLDAVRTAPNQWNPKACALR
jgi:hypothetical protein